MRFFDDLLTEAQACLAHLEHKEYSLEEPWQDAGRNEVILLRDSLYELDGFGFNLVTSQDIGDDNVTVIGPELNRLSQGCRYARISIIQMEDVSDEQTAYNLIRKVEYAKYHYFPKGFMIRTASTSHKEMARVSKSAISDGLSFARIGSLLIRKYKENPTVKSVKLIYVTEAQADFEKLEKIAKRNYDITEALNHIMNNVNFDCSSCNLKPICDEVEGMKELHFKTSGMS